MFRKIKTKLLHSDISFKSFFSFARNEAICLIGRTSTEPAIASVDRRWPSTEGMRWVRPGFPVHVTDRQRQFLFGRNFVRNCPDWTHFRCINALSPHVRNTVEVKGSHRKNGRNPL